MYDYAEAYRKRYENARQVDTDLPPSDIAYNVLSSTLGQLSDGIWENKEPLRFYGCCARVSKKDTLVIEISRETFENPWLDMSDSEVLQFLAERIKKVVETENRRRDDNDKKWRRGNTQKSDYLNAPISDAYIIRKHLIKQAKELMKN